METKANEKQKEFLTLIITELTSLRDGCTNNRYWYAEMENFAMCNLTGVKLDGKDFFSVEDSAKLANAMDTILNLTRRLAD